MSLSSWTHQTIQGFNLGYGHSAYVINTGSSWILEKSKKRWTVNLDGTLTPWVSPDPGGSKHRLSLNEVGGKYFLDGSTIQGPDGWTYSGDIEFDRITRLDSTSGNWILAEGSSADPSRGWDYDVVSLDDPAASRSYRNCAHFLVCMHEGLPVWKYFGDVDKYYLRRDGDYYLWRQGLDSQATVLFTGLRCCYYGMYKNYMIFWLLWHHDTWFYNFVTGEKGRLATDCDQFFGVKGNKFFFVRRDGTGVLSTPTDEN